MQALEKERRARKVARKELVKGIARVLRCLCN